MAAINKLVVARTAPAAVAFYTRSGTLIASGHERVVFGKRGAYVEFSPEQVNMSALRFISYNEKGNRHAYYNEYRSNDAANVKVYLQRRTVKYADYHVGMFYVAPADLEPNPEREMPGRSSYNKIEKEKTMAAKTMVKAYPAPAIKKLIKNSPALGALVSGEITLGQVTRSEIPVEISKRDVSVARTNLKLLSSSLSWNPPEYLPCPDDRHTLGCFLR